MKKKLHFLNAVLLFTAFFLFGCQDQTTLPTTAPLTSAVTTMPPATTTETLLQQTRADQEVYSVYMLALNAGAYTGTYQEWLESVQGPKGDPGEQVLLRVNESQLEWRYEDELTWNALFDLSLLAGEDGVGIETTSIDGSGNLIITYTDDESDNLGPILTVYSVLFRDPSGYLYSSQIVGIGGSATPPEGISKPGYEFTGWTGEYENVRSNTIVLASFRQLTYSVTYDANGGADCETMTGIAHGDSVSLPEPEKAGYRFLGWYQGTSINAAPFYDSDSVTRDLELHARWELLIHNVCFEDEDGTLLLSLVVPHGSSAYLPENPVKQGYTFSEWNHDPTNITADTIMRPLFTPNNYTITFNSNGGSAVTSITLPYLSELPEIAESERIGYTFLGWYTDTAFTIPFELSTMPLGGITLKAKWQIQTFTITYDTQGGSLIEARTLNYNSALTAPEEPFREFFDFVGWSSSPEAYVPYVFTTMPANDLTIYAIWEEAALQYMLLEDETYAVSGVNPGSIEVIVPATYKGAAVTKVLSGAFQNGALVKSLIIAESITTMEAGCFAGLSTLETLAIPFVGTSREATEFNGTLGVLFGTEIYTGSTEITHYLSFTIRGTYRLPSTLRVLTISDADVIRVGSLSGLVMLTEINMSDTITSIEAGALAMSLSLKSMSLPFIGISLTATGTDALLGTIFGKLNFGVAASSFKQGGSNYYLPPALEVLRIDGGTKVNDYALMNLRNLREVSLPSTITHIGTQAFYNDIALANIVLPDQLTRIDDLAFAYDEVVLPSLDPALKAVVLPSSLDEVGFRVFGYPALNTSLILYAMAYSASPSTCWDTLDDDYEVVFKVVSKGVINGLDYVKTETEGAVIIGVHFGNKADSVVIPEYINPSDKWSRVIMIAPGAFANAPYLEQLWIKESVYYVGKNAVGGTNLTVYLELPYIPEWWIAASWNPDGVPVVLNAVFPN